jgi:hypothetical protein
LPACWAHANSKEQNYEPHEKHSPSGKTWLTPEELLEYRQGREMTEGREPGEINNYLPVIKRKPLWNLGLSTNENTNAGDHLHITVH